MYDRGFLPAHKCHGCKAGLEGADTGRPAELYAGTYTGLCNACTSAPAYHERTLSTSYAQVWNHPPSCPAWRRDREAFYAFPDCEECSGRGRVHVSRSDGQGGPFGVQCRLCWQQHEEHPVVVAEHRQQSASMFIWCIISERAQIWFNVTTKDMDDDKREGIMAVTVEFLREIQKGADPSKIPEEWPALKATERKRVLKRAPKVVADDPALADSLFKKWGGNPRKKRRK